MLQVYSTSVCMCLGLTSWFGKCVHNLVYCCVICFLTVPCSSFPSLFRCNRDYAQQNIPTLLSSRAMYPLSSYTQGTQEGKGRGRAGGGDREDHSSMQVCTSWSMRCVIVFVGALGLSIVSSGSNSYGRTNPTLRIVPQMVLICSFHKC